MLLEMTDFAAARLNMVESQIRHNRVTDPRLVAAFETVAREAFVRESMRGLSSIHTEHEVAAGGARALFSRAGALINRGRKGQRAAATRDASRDDRLRSSTSQHGGEPDPPQPGDGPAPRRGLRDGGARSLRRRSQARHLLYRRGSRGGSRALPDGAHGAGTPAAGGRPAAGRQDRKSTRLNSSH